MNSLQEYTISFDNASSSEKIVREFLLARANRLRLTAAKTTEIALGFPLPYVQNKGGLKDSLFLETVKKLQIDYIKQVISPERYNDIKQPLGQKFEHYFFRLSERIKKVFVEAGLLFYPWEKYFYGFEDPTFYRDDEMLGSVISHEPIIILYLSDEEKAELVKKEVVFDEASCGSGCCL